MSYQEVVEKIRNQVDLVDLVSEYTRLKKSGRNYVGLCPFHNEKTPSFSVSREKNLYYCFGCQRGGDIFSFIMEKEKLNFKEAVSYLAKKYNIDLPETSKTFSKYEPLYRMLMLATKFYHEALNTKLAIKAKDYLKSRGIAEETVKEFMLGYAPSPTALPVFLAKKGYNPGELVKIGVVAKSYSGGYYDRFAGRIIFPIFDREGRVVGFGGRALGDEKPKYYNSPQSVIFDKGKLFYGFKQARTAIREKRQAILVEGYFDVISLHQAGIKNVVACLGTAFTEEHLNFLKNYGFIEELILAYDQDAAGEKAALRATQMLVRDKSELTVKVLRQREFKDPDELIKNRGKDAFLEEINKALTPVEFFLELELRGKNNLTLNEQTAILKKLLPYLVAEYDKSPALFAERIGKIASLIQLSEGTLLDEIRRELTKNEEKSLKNSSFGENISNENKNYGLLKVETELLGMLLEYPEYREDFLKDFFSYEFQGKNQELFIRLKENNLPTQEDPLYSYMAYLRINCPPGDPKTLYKGYVRYLEEHYKKQQIQKLTLEISLAEKEGNWDKLQLLINKLQQLTQKN
ncbi:DNA primase [Carboxydothermus pertinax]|uniref:DNA primase n=1 Tax=Carboxydothermus pertinax TaxID=870242 RepID=A0A1L8CWQ1_9THEO|nr:DNA primase [Carboxydothermus pertinax]GAV23333.1 DNA primase [Carboxydothermus pertinax]